MKRLFAVRPFAGSSALLGDDEGNVIYFDNKKAAKVERDALGNGATVTPGPDHKGLVTSSHRYSRKRKLRGTTPVKYKGNVL